MINFSGVHPLVKFSFVFCNFPGFCFLFVDEFGVRNLLNIAGITFYVFYVCMLLLMTRITQS